MKNGRKIVGLAAAAVTLGLFGAGANAAPLPIDLFSTDQALLSDSTLADGGLESNVDSAGGDILGGERDLYVELLTRDAAAPASTADISVGGGALSFSVGSLATGTGTVQWDGNDNSIALDHTGLGGLDLSGYTNFEVVTLFSDHGWEFVVGAYTSATEWTEISFSASEVAVGPVTSYIPLAAFDNLALCGAVNPAPGVNSITCGAGGTVDWSNLGALQLLIDPNGGTTSIDLTLDSVQAVPEPSTLALFGLGLLGAGMMYRRRGLSAS